jgi:hypothetical protein
VQLGADPLGRRGHVGIRGDVEPERLGAARRVGWIADAR